MAPSCGLVTVFCLFALTLFVVSLAFAGDEDEHARDDVALARSLRSVGLPRLHGNEGAVVENGAGRRGRPSARGNRRNNGGGRRGGRGRGGGRGGGGGRRGGGRGGGRGGRRRPRINRRDMMLISKLAGANMQFTLDMYNELKGRRELVFSPHSIHTALTMTYMGARGRTAKEMVRVLGLKQARLKKKKAHNAYAAMVASLTNSGNVTLNVANAVYVKPGLPVEDAFRTNLNNLYHAEFDHFNMNAVGGPEAPINAWVANKTQDKIRNLLGPNTINDLTAMIIINAIYFQGAWKNPFQPSATSQQTFYQDRQNMTTVNMMSRTGVYNYTHADNLMSHIVELPYRDGRFAMYIIVPVARHSLNEVERSLTLPKLDGHVESMNSEQISLHLPKFKTETKISLKAVLTAMGMRVPFSNRAQFDGICSTHDLKITEVIHQAVIEVSEEGTEAAAATAVIIGLRSSPMNPVTVRADHPFIYAIRDKHTKAWIFMGKYAAQG